MATGDLNSDGCKDVVMADVAGLGVLYGKDCPAQLPDLGVGLALRRDLVVVGLAECGREWPDRGALDHDRSDRALGCA